MTDDADNRTQEALRASGVLASFKRHEVTGEATAADHDLQSLKAQARDVIEDIEQKLAGGGMDGETAQKLGSVLQKLRGTLQSGKLTREALTAILTEASAAMRAADGAGDKATMTTQEKITYLWNDIHEKEKSIAEQMEEAKARHDITAQQYEDWLKAYQAAQALPDDDARKAELTRIAAKLAERDLTNAANKAEGDGRYTESDHYNKGADDAKKVQGDVTEIWKCSAEFAGAKNQDRSVETQSKDLSNLPAFHSSHLPSQDLGDLPSIPPKPNKNSKGII